MSESCSKPGFCLLHSVHLHSALGSSNGEEAPSCLSAAILLVLVLILLLLLLVAGQIAVTTLWS